MLLVQEEILIGLYRWAHACLLAWKAWNSGDKSATLTQLRYAEFCMAKLLEDRKKAEHGTFVHWYKGGYKDEFTASSGANPKRNRSSLQAMEGVSSMIGYIEHAGIAAKDPAALAQWYMKVLGMRLLRQTGVSTFFLGYERGRVPGNIHCTF